MKATDLLAWPLNIRETKMIHSSPLLYPLSSFSSVKKSPNCYFISASTQSPFLKFRTSYRDNLRYLTSIGVINSDNKIHENPSPEILLHIVSTVNFLKSRGFCDSQFARLAFLIPEVFSPQFNPVDMEPVFDFLNNDLAASAEDSCALILCCPRLLQSSVQFCLRPTHCYLTELGVENLKSPTSLNAHLLNTRVNKLEDKVRFLQNIGFSREESTEICRRFPAIFGYDIENNLWPKFEYLICHMERSLDELKGFPQYFAFSLEKRIKPRHVHLKTRNVEVTLKRMLLWGDKKFYGKWK